jgi:hypothetical protein
MRAFWQRCLHGLSAPWRGLLGLLRRGASKRRAAATVPDARGQSPDRMAESESEMSEHDQFDADNLSEISEAEALASQPVRQGQPEAVGGGQSDADLEATLESMQGELEDLTEMLAQEEGGVVDQEAVEDLAAESVAPETADEETPEVPQGGTLSDAIDHLEDDETSAVADDAPASTEEAVSPEPADTVEPPSISDHADLKEEVAGKPAIDLEALAAGAASEMAESIFSSEPANVEDMAGGIEDAPATDDRAAVEAVAAGAGFVAARRHAFEDTEIPQPGPRQSGGRRTRGGSQPASAVTSAILDLASFLEVEVNGMWEESRAALADMAAYRDRMRAATDRIDGLEREIRAMRDEISQTRRESRHLQTQMQNIRDDAARARQRADSAALDAQSAADRALSATREIETAASMARDR